MTEEEKNIRIYAEGYKDGVCLGLKRYQALDEKLEIAIEALEFYANPKSNMTLYGEILPTSIRQAREALLKIKGEK